ncbi:hypothetical protein CWI38_1812p0020 [Hamiltosporidium tvaerminnensis]|uniref:Uncharacterized protein n=2 Tax=Hamiltosporidium TaxID=1176354 RepID=A0A4Q9KZK0_9MICR|nr:hypothetical protein CWI39_1676p0030 [Hamiltosporidium magnivora]TBU10373.1 hypothetical protein CWI38_1812p0020 [Hamiltosporidium tvaerminnensis]
MVNKLSETEITGNQEILTMNFDEISKLYTFTEIESFFYDWVKNSKRKTEFIKECISFLEKKIQFEKLYETTVEKYPKLYFDYIEKLEKENKTAILEFVLHKAIKKTNNISLKFKLVNILLKNQEYKESLDIFYDIIDNNKFVDFFDTELSKEFENKDNQEVSTDTLIKNKKANDKVNFENNLSKTNLNIFYKIFLTLIENLNDIQLRRIIFESTLNYFISSVEFFNEFENIFLDLLIRFFMFEVENKEIKRCISLLQLLSDVFTNIKDLLNNLREYNMNNINEFSLEDFLFVQDILKALLTNHC